MKNKRLNNISTYESVHEIDICPLCGAKTYTIQNYMAQELDGSQIEYCEDDDLHVFERGGRGIGGLFQIDANGNIIQKIS